MDRLFGIFNLEQGIVAGLLLLIAGMALLAYSVIGWGEAGFGNLSYPLSLRKVIPAVTMIVLGMQVMFSSFFMSILGLKRK